MKNKLIALTAIALSFNAAANTVDYDKVASAIEDDEMTHALSCQYLSLNLDLDDTKWFNKADKRGDELGLNDHEYDSVAYYRAGRWDAAIALNQEASYGQLYTALKCGQ